MTGGVIADLLSGDDETAQCEGVGGGLGAVDVEGAACVEALQERDELGDVEVVRPVVEGERHDPVRRVDACHVVADQLHRAGVDERAGQRSDHHRGDGEGDQDPQRPPPAAAHVAPHHSPPEPQQPGEDKGEGGDGDDVEVHATPPSASADARGPGRRTRSDLLEDEDDGGDCEGHTEDRERPEYPVVGREPRPGGERAAGALGAIRGQHDQQDAEQSVPGAEQPEGDVLHLEQRREQPADRQGQTERTETRPQPGQVGALRGQPRAPRSGVGEFVAWSLAFGHARGIVRPGARRGEPPRRGDVRRGPSVPSYSSVRR